MQLESGSLPLCITTLPGLVAVDLLQAEINVFDLSRE